MASKHFIVATAGHVDHGKSSLVKALTGIDPDRLPEEKARGITIDLGFAHLQLKDAANSPLDIGIIDVPGHEDFIKNMVAGVGSIDLALFIVAADDGWMPQTEEHLQILNYLGVKRAVVALTKIDLIANEADREIAIEQVRGELSASAFASAPIVPTSIQTGTGIEDLKQALAQTLAETPEPRDMKKPRLPVDRVFSLRGIGTVVTGTLTGGTLSRTQAVVIQPSGISARIRTIQSHNRDTDIAVPGTRTALNLPDIEVSDEPTSKTIRRGDVITLADFGKPSEALDVMIEKSSRLKEGGSLASRPLKQGALVRIHHGSGYFVARVHLFSGTPLSIGQRALGQLRPESPVFAFAGDRFIVRDWAEQATLAGGIILNPEARSKQAQPEGYYHKLEASAASSSLAASFLVAQLEQAKVLLQSQLLVKSIFSAEEVNQAAVHLIANKQAVRLGLWLASPAWWIEVRDTAIGAIDHEHRQRPQHAGLNLNECRASVIKLLPAPELFEAVVFELCAMGFNQTGTIIRRASHRPALPPQLQAAGSRVRAALSSKPMEPPSRKELAPDGSAQQALRYLVQSGEAIEVGEEVVLLTEAYAKASALIKGHLLKHSRATVSELRQTIGASRRIVVPLLEKLDREGITRREGDVRVLRQKTAADTSKS